MSDQFPITVFACPPHCSAGGSISDGGHKFDAEVEFCVCPTCGRDGLYGQRPITTDPPTPPPSPDDQPDPPTCPSCEVRTQPTGGSLVCTTCGLTYMDWVLMQPTPPCDHRMVRGRFSTRVVVCEYCREGANYLFGSPGSKDAVALGCRCPQIDDHYGRGYREWVIDRRCKLHTPADELELEVE